MNQEIDPWANELPKDYEKLFTEFGLKRFDEKILARIKNKNRLFRRGLVFAHRDFDSWLNAYEKKQPLAAMSGIKPSGEFHLGSKMTAEELVFLQQNFGAKIFYAIADLEAYADNGLSLEESRKNAVSNVADLIALGLDPENAYVYRQSRERHVMNLAYLFSKKTTMATLQALYGERNIGLYMAVLTQAGDILFPQLKEFGGPKNIVVPVGVDQDPHLRLTRDLAAKFQTEFGFKLPSSTYHKFFRSLDGSSKMSKRDPMNMLTLADTPELAEKKALRAFTGGRTTWEEQKKLGGEWWKCVIFELAAYHFEEDDKKLEERKQRCKGGCMSCGECKREVIAQIKEYLKNHQSKKKKAISTAEKIIGE